MSKRKPKPEVVFNPVNDPTRVHGYKNVRWVENVSRGLRRVGFADEIARAEGRWRTIEHKGWYTSDDDVREVYRGVVYQLPARDGTQYVYGYADPDNDDCALISFDIVGDKMEAARDADRFAEIFAEEARDYQRAWSAGRKYDDLGDEIKEMRKEALAIAAEMRAARVVQDVPTICATLRGKIMSLYRSIQRTRKERSELLDNFGKCSGFVE